LDRTVSTVGVADEEAKASVHEIVKLGPDGLVLARDTPGST
jgi:hypothetical protein